ncbi:MAG: hypothetical protein AB8V03_04765 [Francisella endosymbiont of Hyalomma asiaticum]
MTNQQGLYTFQTEFILPSFRRKKLGSIFAQCVIKSYKGSWQIRQIQGADYVVKFWLKFIKQLLGDNYQISSVNSPE